MEYKITFEDGSSGYLEHHGVKGMHWGVHNAETKARYNSENRGYAALSKSGKVIAANGKTINKKQVSKKADRQAQRYASKTGASFERDHPRAGTSDQVNVRANAYMEKYNEVMNSKASSRTNRKARKDAKEFVNAKMYYGEGAGTRRKLIKNTVEQRSKTLPGYEKAFQKHVENQDVGKAVVKAKRKRKRTDAINSTKKTGRGVVHAVSGNPQRSSATALAIVNAAKLAKKIAR